MRRHFSCSDLASMALGRATAQQRVDFLEHHAKLCSTCRDELTHLESTAAALEDCEGLTRFASVLSRTRIERLAQAEAVGQREFRALMRLPVGARRHRIVRSLSRFRSPVLVELLLEECRRKVTEDPWIALSLAECAQDAAMRLSHAEIGSEWAMTCLARAHAFRGNALRVSNDLRQADAALVFGWTLFSEEGNGDPLVEAEIFSFFASLRTDQGQLGEAEQYLDRGLAIYQAMEDSQQVARVLVQKSIVLHNRLDFDGALATATEALTVLSREGDPKLYLAAVHNRLWILQEVGRVNEAWTEFCASASLYDQFTDAWTRVRRTWLAGTLQKHRGFFEEALQALLDARDGFDADGQSFYAALVGLDLADLWLALGNSAEVRRVAEETVPVFLAQEVRRDVAAALLLFQEAARQEAATSAMVRQLITSLGQARPKTGRAVS